MRGSSYFRKRTRKTKKRRGTRKLVGKRRRVGTRKRATKKRRGHRGDALRLSIPRIAMNVIPRTADRVRTTLDYKMRAQLLWANTAEQHLGMIIKPNILGPWNTATGPFQSTWPANGSNVLFSHTVSSTPGFSSVTSRYQNYLVTGSKINVKITRQEAADSTTCWAGLLPLTPDQTVNMVLRNSAASPTANNNYLIPQRALTAGITMDGGIANAQLMTIRQQAHNIIHTVTMPYSGANKTTLSQTVSAKKFQPLGYPYGDSFVGILPAQNGPTFAGTTGDGVPPPTQYNHYFFMQRTSAATPGTEAFDIEFDLKVYVTLHNPYFTQSAPTLADDDPGPLDDPGIEEDYSMGDTPVTPNLSNLSLTTPSHATSTCLNPQHPKIMHEKVGTCI